MLYKMIVSGGGFLLPSSRVPGVGAMVMDEIDTCINETFFKPKFKFHLPGYDIYKNGRLVDTKVSKKVSLPTKNGKTMS